MKQARTPLEVGGHAGRGHRAGAAGAGHAPTCSSTAPSCRPRAARRPLPIESAIPALMEGAREPAVVSGAHRRSYYSLLLTPTARGSTSAAIEMVVPVLPGRAGSGLLGLVTLEQPPQRARVLRRRPPLRARRRGRGQPGLRRDCVRRPRGPTPRRPTALDEVALQCLRCGGVAGLVEGRACCAPAAAPGSRRRCRSACSSASSSSSGSGAGGMGVVYRASDLTLGRDVALKTLPQLSAGAAERLMTEARAMASLSHDDVAVLYDVERWRGTPLLVMEYLAGRHAGRRGCARRALRRRRGRSRLVRQLARIARPRARARPVSRRHQAEQHRLCRRRRAQAARLRPGARAHARRDPTCRRRPDGARRSAARGPTWRPRCATAPRRARGSILWALGVVLCEALLGAHPFPRARSRDEVVIGRALALSQLRRSRSDAHDRALERVLALDPAERPATAAEFDRSPRGAGLIPRGSGAPRVHPPLTFDSEEDAREQEADR